MKLGINGWRLHGNRTGVGQYLVNILRQWTPSTVAGQFGQITLYTPKSLDPSDVALSPCIRQRVLPPAMRLLVWENVRLGPFVDDDVLWGPSFSRPLVARCKTVVTTHEATSVGHQKYRRLYGWSARHATLVITHHESSRRDIMRTYGVSSARVRVVPMAPGTQFRPLPDTSKIAEIQRQWLGMAVPFFLYVGTFGAWRNVPHLIAGFAEFKRRANAPHKLVVIGANRLNLDIPALLTEHDVTDHVVHREYIPERDLAQLYAAAEAFVLPCTWAAVSLTTLEAQASGIPVIITDTPGLREMTGDSALYMRSAEPAEIAAAMRRLASERTLRDDLAASGLAHARSFSWLRTAQETMAVLAEAVHMA